MDLDSVVVGLEGMNIEQRNAELTNWSRSGLQGVSVDACVIEQAIAIAMPEPEHDALLDEDEDLDDTYTADGVAHHLVQWEIDDLFV